MARASQTMPSRSRLTLLSLRPLLPRILAHLQHLHPAKCLSLSQSLYEELVPVVYQRVILDEKNVRSFFYGFLESPPGWGQARRGVGTKRKRLSSFPHLPAPEWPLPPITSPTQFSRGRKSAALRYTTHLTLLDPTALSILCAAHVKILDLSPVLHTASSAYRQPTTNTSVPTNPWPLGNVHTLEIGWDLMYYLADSHSPYPLFDPVPICCIPLNIRHLIIHLGDARSRSLTNGTGEGRGGGDGEGWKGGVKRFLKQAIYELAGEWELDTLELVVPRPEAGGVYIPVFDREDEQGEKHPPPARKVVINLSPLSQPGAPYEQSQRVRAYLKEAGDDGLRVEFKLNNARRVVGDLDIDMDVKGYTFVEA